MVVDFVLVLIKGDFFIKRMLATWHPYTRASFLCQWLQSDTGKRMLSSPPASPLPKYGRNRIRAGRRTKTQPKGVIRANVCLVRHPCHNLAYDTKTVNTYREPSPSKRYRPRLRLLISLGNSSPKLPVKTYRTSGCQFSENQPLQEWSTQCTRTYCTRGSVCVTKADSRRRFPDLNHPKVGLHITSVHNPGVPG